MEPERIAYRSDEGGELNLHLFRPSTTKSSEALPAIVFFFGGGWKGGTPTQFYPHCRHFADRGMAAFSAEYRTASSHGTTPFECVEDGRTALLFLKEHAADLKIDPERILAGGGSAGAHVAAAAAVLPHPDADGCRPMGLVLFNPVYDNGPEGYGYERLGERYREISPLHNLSAKAPPTLVLLGTEDNLVSVETAKSYQAKMAALGVRSDLCLYEGAKHGFFNYGKGDNPFYTKTLMAADDFLVSLAVLPPR